jgi:hypothetical protein
MTHKDAKLAPHLESSALGSAFNHSRKYNYKHSVYNNPIHCLHPYIWIAYIGGTAQDGQNFPITRTKLVDIL